MKLRRKTAGKLNRNCQWKMLEDVTRKPVMVNTRSMQDSQKKDNLCFDNIYFESQ